MRAVSASSFFQAGVPLLLVLVIAMLSSPATAQAPFTTAAPYDTMNAAPWFRRGPDINVWENMAHLNPRPDPPVFTDGRNWATAINVSDPNTAQNWPIFDVRNTNPMLFDVQPNVDNQGTLTFQLRDDQCGVADVIVQIRDNTNNPVWGNAETFRIQVECVNSAPYFDIIYENCINLQENAPLTDINVWATDVRAGPVDEVAQNLRFYVEPEDPTFFAIQPEVQITDSSNARLMFQVAHGRSGNTRVRVALHDNGGTNYGGTDTFIQFLELCVADANNLPYYERVTDIVTIPEDEYNNGYRRAGFAYDISPGLGEDVAASSTQSPQTVRFVLSVDNEQMFTTLPALDPQGTLTFATAPDAFGHVEVAMWAEDSFNPPGRTNRTTFMIHILDVNDAPTFNLEGNLVGRRVTECTVAGTCARSYPNFMQDLRVGPTNEGTQTPTVTVAMDSSHLTTFDNPPAIDPVTGALTFTLKQYANTQPTNPIPVTVTVRDNGGTTNGGDDVTHKTFTIEILDQPNPPTFTPRADLSVPITVLENSGQTVQAQWATDVKATPTATSTAGLRFIVSAASPELFAVQPAIALDVGTTASLSFTPAPGRFGTSQVTVYLDNPSTVQNSNLYTFSITITNVNEAPTFSNAGDVVVNQNSGAQSIQWASGISAGAFEDSQVVTFGVLCEPTSPSLFAVAPSMDVTGRLRMTLAADVAGSTTCTVTAVDDGGRSNGGNDRTTADFGLTVRFINQPPTYTPGSDVELLEREREDDQTVLLDWAREMQVGQGNPASQTLAFEVTTGEPSWFKVAPRIDATTGTLSFTLYPYVSGVTTLRHRLRNSGSNVAPDVNESPVRTTQLIVREVNQAPRFAVGPNVAVLQNSGVYRQQAWATSIAAGPTQEASQALTFTLLPETRTLFALPPTVDPATGDLMFSVASNVAGSTSVAVCLSDNGGTENEGTDNTCRSMTVAVTAVNQAPTAVHEPEVVVLEGAGAVSMPGFLTGVTTGPEATDRQQQITSVSVGVPVGQRMLFAEQPAIAVGTYTLTFRMTDAATGSIPLTVTVTDNGGVENGGVNVKTSTVTLRVLSVNQRPTFTSGPAVTVRQGSGAYYSLWATDVSAGPAGEEASSQRLTFRVTADRPEWFAVQPSVNAAGYLSFTIMPDVYGAVALRVTLHDDGGTANGGSDTSEPAALALTISFVNQAPRFTAGADLSIHQNQGPYEYAGWATGIAAGPALEDLTQRGGLVFNATAERREYFSVQPRVDVSTGSLSFTTAPSMFGDTRIFVSLRDAAGTADGGRDTSGTAVVQLRITNVNQAPSFATQSDVVTVFEDAGDQVIADWVTSVSAGANEDATQSTTFSVSAEVPELFASPPRLVGRTLLFTPAANAHGEAAMNVTVSDNGGTAHGGVNSLTRVFTIRVVSVNDEPTFTPGADVSVLEDAGSVTVERWLAASSAGAANENGQQQLTAVFSLNRQDVLVEEPTLDVATGALRFETRANAHGVVVVSMRLRDDGGTTNSGVAESAVRTFRITVAAQNDAPTFVPGSPVLAVSNTVGAYALPWATNVSAGPGEADQQVAFEVTTLQPAMFTASGQPAVDGTGTLRFTVRPGATGNTSITVILRDSQNGHSTTAYILMSVSSVSVNTNVILVMNQAYDGFNSEQFKSVVATELGIDRSQIVVVRVERGSVRVTFQILGTPQGESSDDLTRRIVLLAQDPTSSFNRQLSIIAVDTEDTTSVGAPATPPSGSHAEDGDDGVNYVALGLGIGVGLLVVGAIVIGIVVFVKRREEKKQQRFRQASVKHDPYTYDDAATVTKEANPIHGTFEDGQQYRAEDKQADLYYQDDIYTYDEAAQPGPRPPQKYHHSPSRREPATAVPVMTPPPKVYAQPSMRQQSRWPPARDDARY